ncbi:hypothetical protein [Massilia sp. PWRC2]|uniref:hypothetical protein n=1 Tax=Massilia sp. PWRC2 TaxID=2804626 RepID=UPI003CF8CDBE
MSNKHYGKHAGHCVTTKIAGPAGGVQMETFVPWKLVRRGVKKEVISPLHSPLKLVSEPTLERKSSRAAQDTALLRALGLAYHWQRLLTEQPAATVADIGVYESMDLTQVRRVLRLTLLAPEVTERLISARNVTMEHVVRKPWPSNWSEQVCPFVCDGSLNCHGVLRVECINK